MLTFPLSDKDVLVVIEPGNITRLKQGKPLKVGDSLVCYTPDIERFASLLLGENATMPKKGEPIQMRGGLRVTPEQLQETLDACASLPEVERP